MTHINDNYDWVAAAANAEAANSSDHEQDSAAKLVSLAPGRLEIPDRDNVPVVQIACGLQHTGTCSVASSLYLCLNELCFDQNNPYH